VIPSAPGGSEILSGGGSQGVGMFPIGNHG